MVQNNLRWNPKHSGTLKTKEIGLDLACVASVSMEQRAKKWGFRRFARAKNGARAPRKGLQRRLGWTGKSSFVLEVPTALFVSRCNLFRTMWLDPAKDSRLWVAERPKGKFLSQYTLFQNGRHFSILLFTCKLALVASFKGKYSFEFRV